MALILAKRRGDKSSKREHMHCLRFLFLFALLCGGVLLHLTSPTSLLDDATFSSTFSTVDQVSRSINLRTTAYKYMEFDTEDNSQCSLTVVLTDPRLPYFPANDTIYTKTLESVAEYVPSNACILLQTSVCQLEKCTNVAPEKLVYYGEETLPKNDPRRKTEGFRPEIRKACQQKKTEHNVASQDAVDLAASLIQRRSGPLLKDYWDRGRVRVSVLNHKTYSLAACDVFVSVNNMLLSSRYWMGEFMDDDADQVLVIQRDAFLCKPLRLQSWGQFHFVGSPWHKKWPWMDISFKNKDNRTIFFRNSHQSKEQYSVDAWREYWEQLDQLYTRHTDHDTDCSTMERQVNNVHCPLSPHPVFPKTLPSLTQWVGNGGLSLRSRKWMIRMIRLCPKKKISHLSEGEMSTTCTTMGLQEDMFYSMLLTLTGANIATAEQASLFGVDQDFGWPTTGGDDAKEWLGQDAWNVLQQEERDIGHCLPIGQHKCFLSFRKDGYGCVEQKYCKYSFNEDNRATNMM